MWSRALAVVWLLAAPVAAAGAEGGVIEGTVTFAGPVPALPPIPVEVEHQAHCGPTVPNEALAADPSTGGVAMAVVFVETAPAGEAPAAASPVVLENRGCRFAPHLLAARVGDTLRVRNADPVLHNIRARALGQSRSLVNVVQPTQGQETDREIKQAGILAITCDAHPHMQAYLLAFEHRYFAVTDARGRFRLAGVPPGRHRVVLWHEGVRIERMERGRPVFEAPHVRTAEVTVASGGTARVAFEIGAGR